MMTNYYHYNWEYYVQWLPPASEKWGKVIFSVCVSVHTGRGVPHPLMGGAPPSGPDGGTPILPHGGVPHPSSWGYPIPGLDGGVPWPGKGVPSHSDLGWGYPHPGQAPGQGGTPNWNSTACTCYMVGSMPLAFTQEDFLVWYIEMVVGDFNIKIQNLWDRSYAIYVSIYLFRGKLSG